MNTVLQKSHDTFHHRMWQFCATSGVPSQQRASGNSDAVPSDSRSPRGKSGQGPHRHSHTPAGFPLGGTFGDVCGNHFTCSSKGPGSQYLPIFYHKSIQPKQKVRFASIFFIPASHLFGGSNDPIPSGAWELDLKSNSCEVHTRAEPTSTTERAAVGESQPGPKA